MLQSRHCLSCLLVFLLGSPSYSSLSGQTRVQAPLQVPAPHYVIVQEEILVNAPVERVWRRVGGFCDITEWMNSPEWADCTYLQGSGGLGSMRSIVNEVMVGRTQYSYTYAQPPRKGVLYNLAHGTLAAEEVSPTTTRLTYSMVRDNSMLPTDAARQDQLSSLHSLQKTWLGNMKVLAEGGKLPPKPAGKLRAAPVDPLLNPAPHYETLPLEIEVNAPADKVWARVGKYCDIGEWAFQSCEILSGGEGQLGTIRTIGHSVIIGQTHDSYTYTQPLRMTGLYPMYHGTIEALPAIGGGTTLHYTLLWDSSAEADDAARQRLVTTYRALFSKMLRNMKKLAEGGTLTAEDRKAPTA